MPKAQCVSKESRQKTSKGLTPGVKIARMHDSPLANDTEANDLDVVEEINDTEEDASASLLAVDEIDNVLEKPAVLSAHQNMTLEQQMVRVITRSIMIYCSLD